VPAPIANAVYVQPSPNWLLGQRYAQKAIVTGLFGIFILGIFLGPAAIRHARKAESFNVPAVFGKTLGTIGTLIGVIVAYKMFAPDYVITWVEGATTQVNNFVK
jgi:uncharacterized YccA/Bax inhibitor family protein